MRCNLSTRLDEPQHNRRPIKSSRISWRSTAERKFIRPLRKDAEERSEVTAGGGELGMSDGPGRGDRQIIGSLYIGDTGKSGAAEDG